MPHPLFTIGHSNQTLDAFVDLLRRHRINAVGDVRSWPVCRYTPHFNGEELAVSLPAAGIRYVFLGAELGARRTEAEAFDGAKARYDLIAKTSLFRSGLTRVRTGMESFRLALMCAEKDPLTCHRSILICRQLRDREISHILEDGALESTIEMESRLLDLCGLPEGDLFSSRDELIETAYDRQGERIAYVAAEAEAS